MSVRNVDTTSLQPKALPWAVLCRPVGASESAALSPMLGDLVWSNRSSGTPGDLANELSGPKGRHVAARGRSPGHSVGVWQRPEGARYRGSIPNVPLIQCHLLLLAQLPELILKRPLPMMLRLALDVENDPFDVSLTNGKCSVSSLPRKLRHGRPPDLQPLRGSHLQLLDRLCHRQGAGEVEEEVDMIFDSADLQDRAI